MYYISVVKSKEPVIVSCSHLVIFIYLITTVNWFMIVGIEEQRLGYTRGQHVWSINIYQGLKQLDIMR